MTKHLTLLIGGLAATAILAFALSAAGFGPGAGQGEADGPPETIAGSVPLPPVETVYVRPAATPQVVRVMDGVGGAASDAWSLGLGERDADDPDDPDDGDDGDDGYDGYADEDGEHGDGYDRDDEDDDGGDHGDGDDHDDGDDDDD